MGCSTTQYLFQAAKGQLDLLDSAEPIEKVLDNESVNEKYRDLLSKIEAIKKFADLSGLKKTENYRKFVDLHRPYVSWIVSASPPLKFEAKTWWFPIVGTVPYLGFFDKDDAESKASSLREENLDVYLRGVSAYSTLGWFNDPVLSSMLDGESDTALEDLANVIFHESAHATVYISGQSIFNERFASFVGDQLTKNYLSTLPEGAGLLSNYETRLERSSQFRKKLNSVFNELESIYQSSSSDEIKFSKKKKIIDNLKSWYPFLEDVNNAYLLQFQTYDTSKNEFEIIFEKCESNWNKFFKHMKTLEEDEFEQDQQENLDSIVTKLNSKSCT